VHNLPAHEKPKSSLPIVLHGETREPILKKNQEKITDPGTFALNQRISKKTQKARYKR
jgi:hypothetical protein